MPTFFTHIFVGLAAGRLASGDERDETLMGIAAVGSALPDLDVLTFSARIPYAHPLGHRGFFHSLAFSFMLAAAANLYFYPRDPARPWRWWGRLLFLFVVFGSHGVLDAMTRGGGLGIAFLAPFSNHRYYLPWRVMEVSPIGRAFLSERGLSVMKSEFLWVWIPGLVILALFSLFRRAHRGQTEASDP